MKDDFLAFLTSEIAIKEKTVEAYLKRSDSALSAEMFMQISLLKSELETFYFIKEQYQMSRKEK